MSLKPCSEPFCGALTNGRYCEDHKDSEYDRVRGSASQRGYDSRWRKMRLIFLRSHPLCVACMKHGRYTPANVVDHIKPHKGDKALFWDMSNWQSMCVSCHNSKTRREDMGGWSASPPFNFQ